MMKFSLSSYKLQLKDSGQSRVGYLLRISDSAGAEGYADIFPWPEFGDPSLEDIPKLLLGDQQKWPALLQRSVFMAEFDLKARQEERELLPESGVANHKTITDWKSLGQLDQALSNGFEKIKIKVARDNKEEAKLFADMSPDSWPKNFLRLDCNLLATTETLNGIRPILSHVEYIEDPFAVSENWSDYDGFIWAYDQAPFAYEAVKTQWQIVKPGKQDYRDCPASHLVFGGLMDHPVGLAHGMIQALSWGEQRTPYGFYTHDLYETTAFHELVKTKNNQMSFMQDGPGIGFTQLLQRQPWQVL